MSLEQDNPTQGTLASLSVAAPRRQALARLLDGFIILLMVAILLTISWPLGLLWTRKGTSANEWNVRSLRLAPRAPAHPSTDVPGERIA